MFIPTILERWNQGSAIGYDIYSRLLKDRIMFVGGMEGVVTTDSANLLIAQMLYLDAEDSAKDIFLYINSPGGMVTAGLAVYDTMQYIKAPITTICMGMAMSFGAILLAAGTPGRRMALPFSRVMIHQPEIGGISGQATDIQIEAAEIMRTKKKLVELFAKHTGKAPADIEKNMERNHYMSAAEAKTYGIIDTIIEGKHA
ncbi:MAG: ATP-dependent Clp protease proteolytic subunit [Elusimicrobia bacterium GWA2_69_24]|nr:MAG: ATP-dependent Clp protease proteolytic subunit [Elusimicrobia bacterium GWA2_69_24]HBL17123.1 ATP-dependent Clp protease proteolytic subunit [Elusimicrobiota bacterium]